MKAEMTIKAGKFINREGKEISYITYTAEIMGEEIKFEPRETDKKLLNYLLKGCELENEEDEEDEIDREEVANLKRG